MKPAKNNQVIVFHNYCKGCGLCVAKCPVKVISFSKSKLGYLSTPSVEIDNQGCIGCGICEINCPDCALKLLKQRVNSAE